MGALKRASTGPCGVCSFGATYTPLGDSLVIEGLLTLLALGHVLLLDHELHIAPDNGSAAYGLELVRHGLRP